MAIFIYIVCQAVHCFLTALQFAMIIRAVLCWFVPGGDNPVMNFLISVTEPVIFPVRALLDRFESLRRFPIDISFFVTFILLSIIQSFLPYVHL